jgi:hypothetical protein
MRHIVVDKTREERYNGGVVGVYTGV